MDSCIGCGAGLLGDGTIHDPGCPMEAEIGRRPMIIIDKFVGKYACFGNFFVESDGSHVEGEYQRAKCRNAGDLPRFVGLSPRRAKSLGRSVPRRPDWELVKIRVMKDLVMRKFLDHADLAEILLSTGDAELREENKHDDDFWGTVGGVGANHLGRILMTVRDKLRSLGGDQS